MARINYTGLLRATKDILETDPNVRAARATVEIGRAVVPAAASPHINIYEGRRTPSVQMLDGGQSQWYFVRWQLVVSVFSGEGMEDAMAQRDELLGHVEVAMMASRNLGGFLPNKPLLLLGGELMSNKGDVGFWAQGTLDLQVEIKATTN